MSTLKVNSIEPANAGSEDYFLLRAWVNFNGVGTVSIYADGNVSSITDNNTGDYTVTLSAAASTAYYAPITAYGDDNGSPSSGMTGHEQPLTTSTRLYFRTGGAAAADRPFCTYAMVL